MPKEIHPQGPTRQWSVFARRRPGHRRMTQAPCYATAHTLVIGDHTEADGRVDARVVASVGYSAGLFPVGTDLRAVAVLTSGANRDATPTPPGVFIADTPANAADWQPVDDLAIVPIENGTPTIRFQSRSGRAMPPIVRDAAQRTTKILVLADDAAWRAVVLIADAGTAESSEPA
jgi:hypothetical protein